MFCFAVDSLHVFWLSYTELCLKVLNVNHSLNTVMFFLRQNYLLDLVPEVCAKLRYLAAPNRFIFGFSASKTFHFTFLEVGEKRLLKEFPQPCEIFFTCHKMRKTPASDVLLSWTHQPLETKPASHF